MTNKNSSSYQLNLVHDVAEKEETQSTEELQLTLIPTSENKVLSEIISTERNYDRWANFIFPHTKSTDLKEIRKKEWDLELPNGKKATASILITPAKEGRCYTARTYDIYLALIWFWREFGMPDQPFKVTLSQIAKKLETPTSGKNLKMILTELETLYFTNVSWILSFQDNSQKHLTTKNQRVLDTFNYVTLEERGGLSGQSGVTLQFNENIRNNIRNNITTPVNFTARKSIRSSVAKILYGRIDSILATNPKLERKMLNLVEELNLTPHRYTHKSQRKVLGELLIRNLDGLELSNHNRLKVFLSETVDGTDYKLTFLSENPKKPSKKISPIRQHKLQTINTQPEKIQLLIDDMIEASGASKSNTALYRTIATHYSETLIYRAIGEFKEIIQNNKQISKKSAYFTTYLHITAHKMGEEWIKPCGDDCKHRPQNQ